MATVRKASTAKSNLGFLLIGDKGTYKSELALQFALMKTEEGRPFRVLYIDPEISSIDDRLPRFEKQGVNLDNICIIYTMSSSEVNEYVTKAMKNQDIYSSEDDGYGGTKESDKPILDADGKPFRADAIVIDGATVIYNASEQALVEFSEKRATVKARNKELTGLDKIVAIGGADLEFKDRGALKRQGQELILNLMASGKHYAVTVRSKAETERVRGKDGDFESVPTGRIIPDGFKDLGFNAKTVLIMSRDKNGEVIAKVDGKDRTEIFAPETIIQNPNLMLWQPVIDRNKGKSTLILKNTLDENIKKERELYEQKMLNSASESIEQSNKEMMEKDKLETIRESLNIQISKLKDKTKLKGWFAEYEINLTPNTIKTTKDIDLLHKALDVVSEKVTQQG